MLILFIPFVYSIGKILEARQTGNSIVNPRASKLAKVRLKGGGKQRTKESDINFATWKEGFQCDFRPFTSVQCSTLVVVSHTASFTDYFQH